MSDITDDALPFIDFGTAIVTGKEGNSTWSALNLVN